MSDKVSDEAKDFVASLLVRDPAQRASAAQAMEHPWLSRPRQMPQPALRDAGPGAQRERERERKEDEADALCGAEQTSKGESAQEAGVADNRV